MIKAEKIEYVKKMHKEAKKYKIAGVMPIDALPDRLVQKIRNGLKPDTMVITGRKTLLMRITDTEPLKKLQPYITGSVAIVLSNKDPMDLYNHISSNKLRLLAKPNQISPEDIKIESGETSIAPGQAVTDMKAAGIDVQIQKGKVIISKGKTLVAKGAKISTQVSKALKMLDIAPFEAKGKLVSLVDETGLVFTEQVFKINGPFVQEELAKSFRSALELSLAMNYVTKYNIETFIGRAFRGALAVGVEAKIPEGEVTQKLIEMAALGAKSLDGMVKKEEPAAPAS